ncbi:probable serine/threonine-protein kinase nek3 [Palaemon carinicauda]|uniref:probable serine/threonine-protein kinase nek3 n=1 Tax=Palaemon carinicauda TaxID=392227 RepID=UPI0035B667DA
MSLPPFRDEISSYMTQSNICLCAVAMAQQQSRKGYRYPTTRNTINTDGNDRNAQNDNENNFINQNNGNRFNQNNGDTDNSINIGNTFNNQNNGNIFDHFNQDNGNSVSNFKNKKENIFNQKNGNNLNNFNQNGGNNNNNINSNNNMNNQPGLQNGQQPVSINNDPDKSSFSYRLKQPMYGNFYGHEANRDGNREEGRYYVLLPNRQLMNVRYVADAAGYRPTISFTSIARDAMFDNFLFAPEAKGSQSSNTQGGTDTIHFSNVSLSNKLQLTTTRPQTTACRSSLNSGCIAGTMLLRSIVTTMSPKATTAYRVPATTARSSKTNIQSIPTITRPMSTTIRQIYTTIRPISSTTQPKLTTIRPLSTTAQPKLSTTRRLSTTTQAKLTTTRPLSTTAQPKISTTRRPSTTTQPKLTTTRPLSTTKRPVSTTTKPRLTTTSPRPAKGYFIGVVSTLKPVTIKTLTTPLSSRSTTPRGRTPFFFPKLIQNTGRGQINIAPHQTIRPPLQRHQSPATNNRNNNNGIKVNDSSIANNANGGLKISNGNIGSTGKPNSSTGDGNNISPNAISNGYLPPKVNPKTSPGRQRSEINLFNNGFNFFEFKRMTMTAATPTRVTAQTSQTAIGFDLPINRMTSTPSPPIIRLIQQTTHSSVLPNTVPATRTTSLITATQTPSTQTSTTFSTTKFPVRTTTMHYKKRASPSYNPVPRLNAPVANVLVPSGHSRLSGEKSLQTTASSNTMQPITTPSPSLPPRVEQLSPFFEFFKIKS